MLIYSDHRYLPTGQRHVAMLRPFWGKNPEVDDPITAGRFDRYVAIGSQYFRMVSLEEAEVVILPGEWLPGNPNPLAFELAAETSRLGKPLVIFFINDSDGDIPIENSVILRTSFYRSTRKPNEFATPAWSEDLVERYCGGELSLRPYRERPVVGYCGYSMDFRARLRHRLAALPRFARSLAAILHLRPQCVPWAYLRWQALQALSRDRNVETNFLIRRTFWGGAVREDGRLDMALALPARLEFVQNMLDSDYVLCVRGRGNFSYRLYETLSLGRIPVFVDTDCVLPYDRWIDWKQYVVWVDQSDIDHVAKDVAAFHASLSPSTFQELQRACRRLWEEWLCPEGFFANFYRHFELLPQSG